jgi:hypothetical protein
MWYLNIKQIRERRGIIKFKKLYFRETTSGGQFSHLSIAV